MREKLSSYSTLLSQILLGALLLVLPLLFTTLTTDAFTLPKQILLTTVVLVSFLLFGLKFISERVVTVRRTPLDAALFLFLLACSLSAVFSLNRADSLVSFASLLFAALIYFLFTNFAKTTKVVELLTLALTTGVALTSLIFTLSFFKIYILPWSFTHVQLFTPLGTLLDQTVYLGTVLLLNIYLLNGARKTGKLVLPKELQIIVSALLSLIVAVGLVLSIYSMVKIQPPVVLPVATGFQVGLAEISQDSSRPIQSLLLGSGIGTFATDFSRFKQAVFNQNQNLWSLTFFRSSSFLLELLATTGLLGFLSFLFLVYRGLKQRPLFIPFVFIALVSFLLPLSPISLVLFFLILGLGAANLGLTNKKEYYDVTLALVTLASGFVTVQSADARPRGLSRALPFFFLILILGLVGGLGFLGYRYALANKIFQDSLIAASQNKGSDAYNKQSQALSLVAYNDAYHRVFSQTNIALANSLSNSIPKGSSPSAQTTQTIYTLIQQGINSGRVATGLSPLSAINWQNLSSIYRGLIGFGQNADSFAILASQQAVALDPTNPQEYLNLGGLYYQLKLWDKAEEQFRIAINLKPDFANAYYNLAHALQQKNDIKGALDVLEQVKTLVKNDPENLKKVQEEIDALKKGQTTQPQSSSLPLPPQATPVPLPSPSTAPVASPTPTPTPHP